MSPNPWPRTADDLTESERLRHGGRAAMARGQFDEAVELLRRAIDLDPMSINFELLGESLLALGQVKEAVVALAAGTGLGHNQFKTRTKLAQALYLLGPDFRHDALWQLEEALRLDPGYRGARALLRKWLHEDPSLKEHLHPRTLGE